MDEARRCTVVVHYHGEMIAKERRAWRTAAGRAGLGADVLPHTMRHTAATWLMQRGVPTWQASGFLGMSEERLAELGYD